MFGKVNEDSFHSFLSASSQQEYNRFRAFSNLSVDAQECLLEEQHHHHSHPHHPHHQPTPAASLTLKLNCGSGNNSSVAPNVLTGNLEYNNRKNKQQQQLQLQQCLPTTTSVVAEAAAAAAKTNTSRYKTELCRPFQENGSCKYGDKCQFAHGRQELRSISRHPKYKTDLCRTYHSVGFCPYGPRCHFIHNLEEIKRKSADGSNNNGANGNGMLTANGGSASGMPPLPMFSSLSSESGYTSSGSSSHSPSSCGSSNADLDSCGESDSFSVGSPRLPVFSTLFK